MEHSAWMQPRRSILRFLIISAAYWHWNVQSLNFCESARQRWSKKIKELRLGTVIGNHVDVTVGGIKGIGLCRLYGALLVQCRGNQHGQHIMQSISTTLCCYLAYSINIMPPLIDLFTPSTWWDRTQMYVISYGTYGGALSLFFVTFTM